MMKKKNNNGKYGILGAADGKKGARFGILGAHHGSKGGRPKKKKNVEKVNNPPPELVLVLVFNLSLLFLSMWEKSKQKLTSDNIGQIRINYE